MTKLSINTSGHILGIDGLRGFAALLIVVYHLFTHTGHPECRLMSFNLLRPLHDGWCGVNLFLVLSGLCLFLPFAKRPDMPIEYGKFMRRRMFRIVPAYYVSLIFVPVAFWALWGLGIRRDIQDPIELPDNVLDVLLHLGLLHSLWSDSIQSWNGVTWSLGLEWTWYLLFPLAAMLLRRGQAVFLCAAAAITVAWTVGIYILFGPGRDIVIQDESLAIALRSAVFGRVWEFALGMCVANMFVRGSIPRSIRFWGLPLCIGLLAAAHFGTALDYFLPGSYELYGCAFAVLAGYCLVCSKGLFVSLINHRAITWVGEASFSLYLLHMPIIIAGIAVLKALGLQGTPLFMTSLLTVPLCLLFARMSYVYVELPFIRKRPVDILPFKAQTVD